MSEQPSQRPKPLLIYDGDCTFCKALIERRRYLTGEEIDYAPYQEAGGLQRDENSPRSKALHAC